MEFSSLLTSETDADLLLVMEEIKTFATNMQHVLKSAKKPDWQNLATSYIDEMKKHKKIAFDKNYQFIKSISKKELSFIKQNPQ
ncbi:hypothetical protein AD941_00055 [Gluconobacter albidus]|nr:hypothetical protein AD941_00055 [Gluconobacter albidus]